MSKKSLCSHVVLTSHPSRLFKHTPKIIWGANNPHDRGPVVATVNRPEFKNVIGTHSGSYSIYRALAKASGQLPADHKADLTDTTPIIDIAPSSSWYDEKKIVSLDPWGATVQRDFKKLIENGLDLRPTMAITKAHIHLPEIEKKILDKKIKIDKTIVKNEKEISVTKVAIDPVWYLPGLAERFSIEEGELRKSLFQETGGIYPELITRPDLKVMLPPIGSTTAYIFGDHNKLRDPKSPLTVRVHDECNGSDVFGSDICTCRPYLIHGIEECVQTAQNGGSGIIVYFRKEGRALGEVTKFLVYNARKRQAGGDTALNYFKRTECVAGVEDMRFQELMPDVLHWLGVTKIHKLISMSDMKYNAIVSSGIKVQERISIPDDLIPKDALVEIEAKKAAGYYSTNDSNLDTKGRSFED